MTKSDIACIYLAGCLTGVILFAAILRLAMWLHPAL